MDSEEYTTELKNHQGYNCCQAVTVAVVDEANISKDQIKMISTGFCAGLGAMAVTCSALIGAGMNVDFNTKGSRTSIYTKQIIGEFKKTLALSDAENLKESTQERSSAPVTIASETQSAPMDSSDAISQLIARIPMTGQIAQVCLLLSKT